MGRRSVPLCFWPYPVQGKCATPASRRVSNSFSAEDHPSPPQGVLDDWRRGSMSHAAGERTRASPGPPSPPRDPRTQALWPSNPSSRLSSQQPPTNEVDHQDDYLSVGSPTQSRFLNTLCCDAAGAVPKGV